MIDKITIVPKNINVDNITIDKNINGEIEIKGGAVTNDLIKDNAITNEKIINETITKEKILTGEVEKQEIIINTEEIVTMETKTYSFPNQNKYKKIKIYLGLKLNTGSYNLSLTELKINSISDGYYDHYIYGTSITEHNNISYFTIKGISPISKSIYSYANIEINCINENLTNFLGFVYDNYDNKSVILNGINKNNINYINSVSFKFEGNSEDKTGNFKLKIIGFY